MSVFPRLSVRFLCVMALLPLVSCTGSDSGESALNPSEEHKSGVLVLAGEGFGRESGVADLISREYGLAEEKGRARILYWPETFRREAASLRLFSTVAEEEAPGIILTIGAPEGTVRELRRIRESAPAVTIVSVFPLEEAIPVEAVSDIMIDIGVPDFGGGAESHQEADTAVEISGGEAAVILLGAVFAAEQNDGNRLKSVELEEGIEKACECGLAAGYEAIGGAWGYAQAVDPETGIRSQKHVVIQIKQNMDAELKSK